MDIKERFYANLEMIREDYDHVHKSLADQLQGYADKDKKNRNKNPTNQRWYKKWSSAAKSSRKKAVTGMEEEVEQMDEKAKWRKTEVATKVTDPEGYDSVSYDYHSDNPRSTGMMKATSDKPYKKGSLMTRGKAEVAKGKITKSSAARLKDRIKTNLKK